MATTRVATLGTNWVHTPGSHTHQHKETPPGVICTQLIFFAFWHRATALRSIHTHICAVLAVCWLLASDGEVVLVEPRPLVCVVPRRPLLQTDRASRSSKSSKRATSHSVFHCVYFTLSPRKQLNEFAATLRRQAGRRPNPVYPEGWSASPPADGAPDDE